MKSYRKKGSSLILVVIIFSILSVLGIALISLTVSNYKYRVVMGEAKKSLYASEAGIDESYKIISIQVEEAIKEGNKKVEEFTKEEMDKEIEKEKKKDVDKKEALKNGVLFVEEDWDSSNQGSLYISVSNDVFDTTLLKVKQKEIFSENFKLYVKSNLVTDDQVLNGVYEYKSDGIAPKVKVSSGSLPLIFNKSIVDESKYILSIKLESNFKNKDGIKKAISAEYEILAPEYGQNYSAAINTIKIPNMVWSKAIAVDGNMYVGPTDEADEGKSVALLNIGEESKPADIYVKGKEGENNGIVFQSQGATVNIFGEVITNQDFLLGKKTTCTVNGSIYGKNVKVGKNDDILRLDANNSILKVEDSGSVYTSDDLELNANSSEIMITGNFYGIDDGSLDDSIKFKPKGYDDANKSSTIVVNSDDIGNESSLRISGDTLISGVAYIDVPYKNPLTGKIGQYQTGESVAIKGNYIAYTNPLDVGGLIGDDKKLAEVDFEYFEPLTLISTYQNNEVLGNLKKQPLTADDKSRYFKAYDKQYKTEGQLKLKGVILGKWINASGAVVSDGKIIPQNDQIDDSKIISEKRDQFNKSVNNMATQTIKGIYPDAPNNIFGNKVNINKLKDRNKLNGETLIYIKKDFNKYELDFNSVEYASVRKGIIIVNGDLTIKGNMDFTGSIIVSGDLKIIGSKDNTVNIKYDKEYVRNLIIQNYFDVFKDVFVNDNENNNDLVYDIQLNSNYGLEVNKDTESKTLIKLKNWKIN